MIIVIMGICSCGKTLIGQMLAEKLSLPFYDADDFHPQSNIVKMKSQIPLDDNDRFPWLEAMARQIPKWQSGGGAVLACSALKEFYRDILRKQGEVKFIFLKGTKDIILNRMKDRQDHYMPTSLIDSQLKILEEPHDAITIDIEKTPDQIVDEIVNLLNNSQDSK
ncbi:MAG: gluconokinase [Planctomycetota bacterium]|jgi:carbohydrate kinase (thermoresistant glucokinase family)